MFEKKPTFNKMYGFTLNFGLNRKSVNVVRYFLLEINCARNRLDDIKKIMKSQTPIPCFNNESSIIMNSNFHFIRI